MHKTIAFLISAALLVPALALGAANPAKNSVFRWCPKKNSCPLQFSTDKRGRYLKDISAYTDCATVPADYGKIRVRNGKFAKTGTATDVIGRKVTYSFKGHFVTKRKAVGTYDLDRTGCKSKALDFVAKRMGGA